MSGKDFLNLDNLYFSVSEYERVSSKIIFYSSMEHLQYYGSVAVWMYRNTEENAFLLTADA